jgi:hypothetical protein
MKSHRLISILAIGTVMLALTGCGFGNPEGPRVVGSLMFSNDEVQLGVAPFAHQPQIPPEIRSAEVHVTGRRIPLEVDVDPWAEELAMGRSLSFSAPQAESFNLVLHVIHNGNRFRIVVPFELKQDSDLWKWQRSQERVTLLGPAEPFPQRSREETQKAP